MVQPRRALSLVLLAALALPCSAGGVRIVGSPDIRYFEISEAVAAASDGDVLLVGAGTYQGFTIDGMSLTVATLPGVVASVEGTVTVKNLAPSERVLLVGLSVLGAPSPTHLMQAEPGLRLTNNSGHVRIVRSAFTGGLGGPHGCGYEDGGAGGHGAFLSVNAKAVFVSCTFLGGKGYGAGCCSCIYSGGGRGGDGVYAALSATALYGCSMTGGEGGMDGNRGGDGGDGYFAGEHGLFASGSSFRGGDGGDAWDFIATTGGDGGDGLEVFSAQAQLLDDTFTAGNAGAGVYPGVPGQKIKNAGAVNHYVDPRRLLLGNEVVSSSTSYALTVQGVPGEAVFLYASPNLAFAFVKALTGVWLMPLPMISAFRPQGVIPANGSLVLTLQLPDLVTPTALVTYQAVLLNGPTATLTGPLSLVQLDREAAPDCNGNLVSDFVNLLEGTSLDSNTDLIPDECQYQGPDWYVDASAAIGGNGSQAAPFRDLRQGLDFASSGHTVHVADGTYVGPSNRGLELGGHDVVVKSVNGPAACILDAQGAESVFRIHQGESSAARIEGFTIRNGASTTDGGGIEIINSSPTIEGCVIVNCTAGDSGGGIYALGGSPQIRNTTVRGCTAQATANISGGGGIALLNSNGSIERCTLESNSVPAFGKGGGAFFYVGNGTSLPSISHCVVRGNSAYYGGGINVQSFVGLPARVTNCLVVGNGAHNGGGMMLLGGSGPVELCTIAFNSATTQGGGVYVVDTSGHVLPGYALSNSILWGNSSPSGAQIRINGTSAKLSVDYCDVQGGQAGVSVQGGVLTWGAGNLDLDPKFADLSAYRLLATSPCVDAGDNLRVPLDVLDIDGDGNTSELLPIDLDGLARFGEVLSAPNTGNGTPPIVDMGAYELAAP